jgi:hypothetical protein
MAQITVKITRGAGFDSVIVKQEATSSTQASTLEVSVAATLHVATEEALSRSGDAAMDTEDARSSLDDGATWTDGWQKVLRPAGETPAVSQVAFVDAATTPRHLEAGSTVLEPADTGTLLVPADTGTVRRTRLADLTLGFGKHKDKTFKQLLSQEKKYTTWLRTHFETLTDFNKGRARTFLEWATELENNATEHE